MLRRAASLIVLVWLLGFVWFAVDLPQPRPGGRTDAIIVLTGGPRRIEHALALLAAGRAPRLLVSGVDRQVRPAEFRAEYRVSRAVMRCCVTLGFAAFDTRSNAREAANWLAANRVRTARLVTSDWHMRRARLELARALPTGVVVIEDAVATEPTLRTLFLEYNKLIARWVISLWER